jgi:hypothetical protein
LRKITEGRSARSLSLLVAATSRRVRNTSSLSLAVTAMVARRCCPRYRWAVSEEEHQKLKAGMHEAALAAVAD